MSVLLLILLASSLAKPVPNSPLDLAWTVSGSSITINVTCSCMAWVGLGLNAKPLMIGTDLFLARPGTSSDVKEYSISDQSAQAITENPQSLLTKTWVVQSGSKTSFGFTRLLNPQVSGSKPISLTESNLFTWATGSSNTFEYHGDSRGSFLLNLETGSFGAADLDNELWQKIHATMMALSWTALFPFGIMYARLCKSQPNGRWFKVHKYVQGTSTLIAVTAACIAAASTQRPYGSPHSIMGTISICSLTVQASLGVFRPHKPEEGEQKPAVRLCWEIFHKSFGVTLVLFSLFTQTTGFYALNQVKPWIYIWAAAMCLMLFLVAIAEIRHRCCVPKGDEED